VDVRRIIEDTTYNPLSWVVKPASVNTEMVSILDFAPTFLDFANSQIPPEFQGKSIRPLLIGKNPDNWRKEIYYHYFGQYEVPEQEGIRTKEYKLIHFKDSAGNIFGELYDLRTDNGR